MGTWTVRGKEKCTNTVAFIHERKPSSLHVQEKGLCVMSATLAPLAEH